MLLRFLSPPIAYNLADESGSANVAAPAPAVPTGAVSSTASEEPPAAADTSMGGSEAPHDEPKLSLDEQLDKIWDDAHRTEPERDERGRFKSNRPPELSDGSSDDAEFQADDPPEKTPDQPADEGKGDTGKPAADTPMPQSWSKDKADIWTKLTPEAREFIAARETEVTQALSRAGRAFNTLKNVQPVIDAVEPFREYLGSVGRHLGRNPSQLIHDTLRFEHTLRTGDPATKLAVLKDIVSEYGIDITPIVGPEGAQALRAQAPARDPRVDQLAQTVQSLTHKLTAQERAQAEAANADMSATIQSFAQNTKEYPHFAAVRPLMSAILQAMPDDGSKTSQQLLTEAYEQACWSSPPIRAALIAQQKQAEDEKARAEREARANRARSAAAPNVRSGVPSPPKRTIDDDLDAIAAKHYR